MRIVTVVFIFIALMVRGVDAQTDEFSSQIDEGIYPGTASGENFSSYNDYSDYGNYNDYSSYGNQGNDGSAGRACTKACAYGYVRTNKRDTEFGAGVFVPLENPDNHLEKARAEQLRNRDRRTIIQDIVQACSRGDTFAVQLYSNEYKALGGDIPASLSLTQCQSN